MPDVHEGIDELLGVLLAIPIPKAVLHEVAPPGLLRRNEDSVVEPINRMHAIDPALPLVGFVSVQAR
jgi:hypothetical protein